MSVASGTPGLVGLFISTSELADLLENPHVRIVDMRVSLTDDAAGRRDHQDAHIPGAVYMHWLDISDPNDPIAGQLAPAARFSRAMERAGISDDTLVVCYDDNVVFTGARLAWCLRYYGHELVRILDGGFPKWSAEGRPVDSGANAPPALGNFSVRSPRARRATKQDVVALLTIQDRKACLLDCRMDATWKQAGAHIPGARRLPAPSLVDPKSGTLLPPEEIGQAAAAAGAVPGAPIVLYCGGGVSASFAHAALESSGFHDLTVYDGSWSEWSVDPLLPQERHDSPA